MRVDRYNMPMSKKHIIVVEDERDLADMIAIRLKRDGHRADVAYDGQEAITKIKADVPDMVLLDLMLPKISGLDVLRELRADPRTNSIPVVILTAKSEESDVVVGLQLGADDYVTKPFSMSVLMARVSAVLRRSAAAGASEGPMEIGQIKIDSARHLVQIAGKPITLTRTEFRLLLAMAAARGRVLTRNQLIDQTIGLDAVVT
ncbi:MAG: response regulator, partial [Planctomycetaceae bacterium]